MLPSVDECRRLQRLLPNARTTELPGSGHVPLLEARISLAPYPYPLPLPLPLNPYP